MTLRRGGADAHDKPDERHWTVRGFQKGRPKCTFHVFSDTNRAEFFGNGGRGWKRGKGLDVERKCRRLGVIGEGAERVVRNAKDESEETKQVRQTVDGDSNGVE